MEVQRLTAREAGGRPWLVGLALLLSCGGGGGGDVVRLPAPPEGCWSTVALAVPDDCSPDPRAAPVAEGALTCTWREGARYCGEGLDRCWWIGSREPGAAGTITCSSGACRTAVEVVGGAAVPEGARGEWARLGHGGRSRGFTDCDPAFPGAALRTNPAP